MSDKWVVYFVEYGLDGEQWESHVEYCPTEAEAEVLGSVGAMLVKREDLRTNSDLRRLKSRAITEKDVARVAKYMAFYALIESKLAENG